MLMNVNNYILSCKDTVLITKLCQYFEKTKVDVEFCA